MEYNQKGIRKFVPINIIYKPVKHQKVKINFYFPAQKHLAYRSTYDDENKTKHSCAWQCHYCSNCYGRKDNYERPLEHCRVIPRIVYNFETQNLVTSEDNLKYRGDVPLLAYCDFETTAQTDSCVDPKNRNVSYVITFAFHPEMNLDRISQKGHLLIAWIN